ncbi:MAG TPA: DinB family protein [Methylomirabilota bacterium]|nr:DinB family protein [Methylomirabilota bacterium]
MTTSTRRDLDGARRRVERALEDLLAVPDAALEGPWQWPDHGEADVRYGIFRVLEDLEATAAAIDARGVTRTPAESIVAPATVARWDLIGLLTPLTGEELDADPGRGGWTIRQTVAHIIASQHSYGVYTAWWREQGLRPGAALPDPPDDLGDPAWDEAIAGDGTLEEIRRRFHDALDGAAARLTDLTSTELALAARWSGLPVTVGFRQGRWSSHIAEHMVQVDKTLAWLGREPSEVERLLRRVAIAWGRLESLVWPGDPAQESMVLAAGAAARAAETAASVRAVTAG